MTLRRHARQSAPAQRHRRRRTQRDRPDVQAHLYTHSDVQPEHLRAFTRAPEATQQLVLAELRLRAEDQEATLLIGLEAAALAILAILFSVAPTDLLDSTVQHITPGLGGWFESFMLLIAYAVITLAIMIPSMINAVRRNRDHGRAVVWLRAYEQALSDRQGGWGRALRTLFPDSRTS